MEESFQFRPMKIVGPIIIIESLNSLLMASQGFHYSMISHPFSLSLYSLMDENGALEASAMLRGPP